MKLEDLLGADLYAQVKAKLDKVNAKEPDELKHVRYEDLSEGKYISKSEYDTEIGKLNAIVSGKDTELTTANGLIAELKKGTKGNEELQGKITGYETQVQQLQEQLAETKIKAAIKVALLSAHAVDVDYLTFKLNEKLKEDGSKLELDENENIKGWEDKLSGLKTQFPNMFEGTGGKRDYQEHRIDTSGSNAGGSADPKTLAEALKMKYEHNEEE